MNLVHFEAKTKYDPASNALLKSINCILDIEREDCHAGEVENSILYWYIRKRVLRRGGGGSSSRFV